MRLHGRNRDTYFARNVSAADRFDYLYTPDELEEWAPKVRELAEGTDVTYVMFNNCKYDYAPRNARELAEILGPELVAAVAGRDERAAGARAVAALRTAVARPAAGALVRIP